MRGANAYVKLVHRQSVILRGSGIRAPMKAFSFIQIFEIEETLRGHTHLFENIPKYNFNTAKSECFEFRARCTNIVFLSQGFIPSVPAVHAKHQDFSEPLKVSEERANISTRTRTVEARRENLTIETR